MVLAKPGGTQLFFLVDVPGGCVPHGFQSVGSIGSGFSLKNGGLGNENS